MGRRSSKASKMKRHSSLDDLSGRPYRLPIDRNQIRRIDQIDCPQNGHEYLYLAKKMDEKLPDVLTAPDVDLQIYVKNFYQETDRYVVPKFDLTVVKNKKLLPTKAEMMAHIEQFENYSAELKEIRKCVTCPQFGLPTPSSPGAQAFAWFEFLFGRTLNCTTSVNPVHNIERAPYFLQIHCAAIISYFVQWVMKKILTPKDVAPWTFALYACMDRDPCDTLLSDMRILTQIFINARAELETHLDILAVQYSCLINVVSEKFKQKDLGDIFNYNDHYSGSNKDKRHV